LWKNTLTHTVSPGAIPRQIDYALLQLCSRPGQSNFTTAAASLIPPPFHWWITRPSARSVAVGEPRVVESHPRLSVKKALRFRDLLLGTLEVAMGLETVHPQVLRD